jgi:hypothetical protein
MRVEQRSGEKGPWFERGLHLLSDDDACHPAAQCRGRAQGHWLLPTLLVFPIGRRRTPVLPLYEGVGQITNSSIFLSGEHEGAAGPVFVANASSTASSSAFATSQIAIPQAVIPFDLRVGDTCEIHSFHFATRPGPLYGCGPVNHKNDMLARMAPRKGTAIRQQVRRVVRWQLDEAEARPKARSEGGPLIAPLVVCSSASGMHVVPGGGYCQTVHGHGW